MINTCPTPWKMPFTTRRETIEHMRRARARLKDGQIRPYPCPCGRWHTTSMSKKESRAAKRRLAA